MSEDISPTLNESEDVVAKGGDDPCPAILEIGHPTLNESEDAVAKGGDDPCQAILEIGPPTLNESEDVVANGGGEACPAILEIGPPTLNESEDVVAKGGDDPCPAILEIGPLSPIHCGGVLQETESCQDEGYITRSFTQDLPITPIMSTPLRPQKQTPDLVAGAEAALVSVNSLVPYNLDDSSFSKGDGVWESTLLEVQVKSKVVLKRPAPGPSPAVPVPVRTFKAGRRVTPPANKRPRVFESPEEWQREKSIYVESVSRHMKENPKGGVINELLDLMNTVASEQHPWQHPSDLTTRNYQPGNQGQTLYSLDQWISKNGGDYRRFSRP